MLKRRNIFKLIYLRHNFLLFSIMIQLLVIFTSCNNDDDATTAQIITSEAILGKWELIGVTENNQKVDVTNCKDREFYTFSKESYQLEKFKSVIKVLDVLPCKEENFSGDFTINNNVITFDTGKKNERKLQVSLESGNLRLTFKRSLKEIEKIKEKIANGVSEAIFFPFGKVFKSEEQKEITVIKKYKKVTP